MDKLTDQEYDELAEEFGIAVLTVMRKIASLADLKATSHETKLAIINGLAMIAIREICDKLLESQYDYLTTVKEEIEKIKSEKGIQ